MKYRGVKKTRKVTTPSGAELKPRCDLLDLSRKFMWGDKTDPATAQLSLALLCDFLGNDMEPPLLFPYFAKLVVELDMDSDFELTMSEIHEAVEAAREKRKKPILRGRNPDGSRPGVGGAPAS
jgi:hypothetical protein